MIGISTDAPARMKSWLALGAAACQMVMLGGTISG